MKICHDIALLMLIECSLDGRWRIPESMVSTALNQVRKAIIEI